MVEMKMGQQLPKSQHAIRSTTQVLGEEEGDIGEPSLLSTSHTQLCVCELPGSILNQKKGCSCKPYCHE